MRQQHTPPNPGPLIVDAAHQASRLRNVELVATRVAAGLHAGMHDTARLGPGTDRADARAYTPGDDVRHIDWMASARTGETHTRDTLAEREATICVIVDAAPSMQFGSKSLTKFELAVALGAGVCVAASGNRDSTTMLVAGSDVTTIAPRRCRPPVNQLVAAALAAPTSQQATLREALRRAGRSRPHPKLIVVASDMLSDSWERTLRAIAGTASVIVLETYDPLERQLVRAGVTEFDVTGERIWVDTDSLATRTKFAQVAAERADQRRQQLIAAGASHVPVECATAVSRVVLDAIVAAAVRAR